ncbi:unnamed protein product, partial [Allacma fusca]
MWHMAEAGKARGNPVAYNKSSFNVELKGHLLYSSYRTAGSSVEMSFWVT